MIIKRIQNTVFKKRLVLFLGVVLVSCGQQNKDVHFGEAPLQLKGFNFDLDIPNFFNDEAYFRHKADISMRAEEEMVELDDQDEPFEYVRYSQSSFSSDTKVAAYGDLVFRKILLCTDLADENTYLVGAQQEDLTASDIDKLVNNLKKDYGTPTPYIDIEKKNDRASYEWYLEDKVVKLVLNVQTTSDMEEAPEDGWQRILYDNEEDLSATLFIATKQFDQVMQEAYSFSGMLVYYR